MGKVLLCLEDLNEDFEFNVSRDREREEAGVVVQTRRMKCE